MCVLARPAWPLAAVLGLACGDDGAPREAAAPPVAELDPAAPGKVEPAPASELALARTVLEALRQGDFRGYTNVLVTRADMMGLYADEDRGVGRERRERRRMVWRRVNRLRDGEAEEGWASTRRRAAAEGLAWDAVRLVDVRREPAADGDLPEGVTAARLLLVLEHAGARRALSLGTCVRASRGWVVLHPMAWQELGPEPLRGESLLGAAASDGSHGLIGETIR